MDEHIIVARLARAEQSLASGHGLGGTGFWAAVAAVRRDPSLAATYAGRIATVDRMAFEASVRLRTTLRSGLWLLGLGTATGMALVAGAVPTDGAAQTALLLAAWGVLTLSTHSLAHWLVGRHLGIGFTHVFIGHFPEPFPGVKIDYATYLPTPPRLRALMHASGAVASKIVPFALLGAATAIHAPDIARSVLLVAGIVSVVIDGVGWFVTGDWKKVRRELHAATSWAERGRRRQPTRPDANPAISGHLATEPD